MTAANAIKFEKLSRNAEILRMIFNLLEFEEQLKLATVCQHLHYYFRHFIWKDIYRNISVTKNEPFFIVHNRETSKDAQLSTHGLEYFLSIYAGDVEKLIEKYGYPLNCQRMRNLKAISYNHMIITNDDVELLSRCYTKLEKLQIYGCCNKERNVIHMGEDIKFQTLIEMKMLKHFTLKAASDFRGRSNVFHDILTQLKLKYYNLKTALIGSEETAQTRTLSAAVSTIEELDIYAAFSSSLRSCNLKEYLKYFQNLTSLTISIVDVVNGDEVLTSLATNCKKLKILSFKFTTLENIQKFAVFSALRELSFHWCKGLTYENLKEILSEMHLEKFSSIYTKYQGLFQYYFVSPTLKSIHIDAFHSFEFRSS